MLNVPYSVVRVTHLILLLHMLYYFGYFTLVVLCVCFPCLVFVPGVYIFFYFRCESLFLDISFTPLGRYHRILDRSHLVWIMPRQITTNIPNRTFSLLTIYSGTKILIILTNQTMLCHFIRYI